VSDEPHVAYEHRVETPEDASLGRRIAEHYLFWGAVLLALLSMLVGTDTVTHGPVSMDRIEFRFDLAGLVLALVAALVTWATAKVARAGLRYVRFPAALCLAALMGAFVPQVAYVAGGGTLLFGLGWIVVHSLFE